MNNNENNGTMISKNMDIKSFLKPLLYILMGILLVQCSPNESNILSLEGQWTVRLDSMDVGEKDNWAVNSFQGTKILLPGTLDDAAIGAPNTLKPELNNYVLSNLARKHQYIGKAWYQKEIVIPQDWNGKGITLTLERVIWESVVFVDGHKIGNAESLIGSHTYDLSEALSPGKHLLTIRIDNGNKYPLINIAGSKYPDPINQDMAHGYTNHTQIKWNGILGDMVLEASEKNAPENLQIYPNTDNNTLRMTFRQPTPEVKSLHLEIVETDGVRIYQGPLSNAKNENGKVDFQIERPEAMELWDEFNPKVYKAMIISDTDTLETTFGFQNVAQENGELMLNGKRIFLRGNLECAIFPITGHPPMEKEAWGNLISQAKAYGLNHLRFHSWCPPKAAFEAADEAGFYFQVELAHWSLRVGEDEKTTEYLRKEADKLLRDYGNHPSFLLFALGNELQGDAEVMNSMIAALKKSDNRHLYMTTTFSFQKPMGVRPEPEDEYFVTQWTDKGWIRGQGIFNDKPPHFDADYSQNSSGIEVPLISHEIGQYAVYPDMAEIPKYTGVLEPLNFLAIRNDLGKKGLLELADDFTKASGKLAALLYKEEIERALKTASFDGFQLLQLQDFPGQGTALVGLLNAFWESKGIISSEEFSQFNSELVPLLRFEKAVYENGEVFKADIEIANFYKELKNQTLEWSIIDEQGNAVKEGVIRNVNLQIGNNLNLGSIAYAIDTKKARRLKVRLSVNNTKYTNQWFIWEYPKNEMYVSNEILFTNSMEEAFKALQNGKKVLLNPDFQTIKGIEGRFVPVFWSPVHFPDQPATMGLLVDEVHPAFKDFPTSSHTDWQWWDLCIKSKSVILDSLQVTPLVRVIDNFVTNHHLANVFEAKVGSGSLLFSTVDISNDLEHRPVARQLRYSLLKYMESDSFQPSKNVEIRELKKLKSKEGNGIFSTEDIYD